MDKTAQSLFEFLATRANVAFLNSVGPFTQRLGSILSQTLKNYAAAHRVDTAVSSRIQVRIYRIQVRISERQPRPLRQPQLLNEDFISRVIVQDLPVNSIQLRIR